MKRPDGEESGPHQLVLASPLVPERQLRGPPPNPRPREQPRSKWRRPQAQLPSFRAARCWGHIWHGDRVDTTVLVWSCCVETTAICTICVTRTQAGGDAANQPSQVLGTLAASRGAALPQRRHLWAPEALVWKTQFHGDPQHHWSITSMPGSVQACEVDG